jgi:hypothetical protein
VKFSRTVERAARAIACILLTGWLGAQTITAANAADPARAETALRSTSTAAAGSRPQAKRLSDLAAIEDEGLTRHAAGEWSDSEVVVVILLLIFLFPIGVIVLIILLCTHGG